MKTLFSMPKKLTKAEIDFDKVEKFRNNEIDRVTTDDICRWYAEKYRRYYSSEPLDYNIFNTRKVFNSIMEKYKLSKHEFVVELNNWFVRYNKLSKSGYETLTISSMRKEWVINALMNNKQTYLKNGKSTTNKKVNNDIVSDEYF